MTHRAARSAELARSNAPETSSRKTPYAASADEVSADEVSAHAASSHEALSPVAAARDLAGARTPRGSARASRLVPPSGPQRVLALAQLSNSVGDGAYYATSALYFTHVVGLSPGRVGLGLTVAWAIGSLVGVPLGGLADRRGPRGTAVLLALATATAVASFLVVQGFVAFVVAACAYASAQSGLGAARQALLAALIPAA